jgi:hypothetical protein
MALMANWELTMVDIVAITGIATVAVLSLTLGYYIYRDKENRKPQFQLEKVKEEIKKPTEPIDSSLTLRVKCIKNHVLRCSVFIGENKLAFINYKKAFVERSFYETDSVNYRIPSEIVPNRNDMVTLKNDSKVLGSWLWKDIPWEGGAMDEAVMQETQPPSTAASSRRIQLRFRRPNVVQIIGIFFLIIGIALGAIEVMYLYPLHQTVEAVFLNTTVANNTSIPPSFALGALEETTALLTAFVGLSSALIVGGISIIFSEDRMIKISHRLDQIINAGTPIAAIPPALSPPHEPSPQER